MENYFPLQQFKLSDNAFNALINPHIYELFPTNAFDNSNKNSNLSILDYDLRLLLV